ncbi:hypothetical protein HG537_0A01660 [Torulaspora globosa]|uniref:Rab-GAP TBC domain-containing protein n=1 Tax=Torulaspora globosa TaxID=48254 RepID=A0A7H9HKS1_9SACH|nr:hypothetical protein HG537_0A01660 [Torulaspora sp. CBS 2947]
MRSVKTGRGTVRCRLAGMLEKKSSMSGPHHHMKHLKQQQQSRELVETIIDLVEQNDHDSLAFIARNCGVPPQLRHVVWPILLRYHPMCISPNIMSNVITWDPHCNSYSVVESQVEQSQEELDGVILHDLRKYFHSRGNGTVTGCTTSSSEVSTVNSMDISMLTVEDESVVLNALKRAILRFLNRWSKIFKYESGLAWIATGLAEWVPVQELSLGLEGPVVLSGKKHTHPHSHASSFAHSHNSGAASLSVTPTTGCSQSANVCLCYLYKEYPLPAKLRSKLPNEPVCSFDHTFERLVLVILHCPDTILAQKQTASHLNTNEPHPINYFPVISGGDLSYQTQVFFKVFSTILPELYQPFTEESVLQTSNRRVNWLYWWLKCSGARALQKQDRARLWDILLGWRPKPNMSSINFFLNYNTKKFDHLYKEPSKNHMNFLKSLAKNDPFWFPDLDLIPIGTPKYRFDYEILKEILRRNRYGQNAEDQTSIDEPQDDKIPYSLIDPHIQLLFVYVAILQYNEFKLLEFEETEISEFLTNVPMLSKADDYCYRKLYDTATISESSHSSSQEDLHKRPGSSNMLIEVGNDAKASHSFDDLLSMAGDIWRKWLWAELEESSIDE